MVGKQIHDSKAINGRIEGDYINLSTSRSMNEIGILSLKKYGRSILIYYQVIRALLTQHYEVCYLAISVSGLGLLRDFPLVMIGKLLCKKVVIHQHNKGIARYAYKSGFDFLYRHMYRNTKIILLSWYLYDEIAPYVKKEDVFICPNGIGE